MNEDHIAFHEIVTLLGWKDSSSRGPIVTIGLASRASLEHFDTATRRKGKRAGQRYHASLNKIDGNGHIGALDLWFAGANWAHQDGARVVFTVAELELFLGMTAKDEKHGTPEVFWLTLVQVDEDETPIDQRKASTVEQVFALEAVKKKPAGGPRSKQVAMLCQDHIFQLYVERMMPAWGPANFSVANSYVKEVCGVLSKVEFDHNEATWETFIAKVRRPFLEWAHVIQTA